MKHGNFSDIIANDSNIIPFINLESIPISVITWNVNAHLETPENIREKLLTSTTKTTEHLIEPQIVVVGLQEMVELSTSSVIGNTVVGQQCLERAQYWQTAIFDCLHDIHPEFELMSSTYMIGVSLFIFAWRGIKTITRNVQVSSLPRGVGGVLGNKGAIYIRMDILDTSICFVNAHFAAHREAIEKRNRDFHAIMYTPVFVDHKYRKSIFPYLPLNPYANPTTIPPNSDPIEQYQFTQMKQKLNKLKQKLTSWEETQQDNLLIPLGKNTSSKPSPASGSFATPISQDSSDDEDGLIDSPLLPIAFTTFPTHAHEVKKTISADDHDIVIWLGDLNYRIVESMPIEDVYMYIDAKRYFDLSSFDQLSQAMNNNQVFYEFSEGLLTFPPSYQYIPSTSEYDTRLEGKQRCPAWCDRILWRIGKNQRAPNSVEEVEGKRTKGKRRSNSNTLSSKDYNVTTSSVKIKMSTKNEEADSDVEEDENNTVCDSEDSDDDGLRSCEDDDKQHVVVENTVYQNKKNTSSANTSAREEFVRSCLLQSEDEEDNLSSAKAAQETKAAGTVDDDGQRSRLTSTSEQSQGDNEEDEDDDNMDIRDAIIMEKTNSFAVELDEIRKSQRVSGTSQSFLLRKEDILPTTQPGSISSPSHHSLSNLIWLQESVELLEYTSCNELMCSDHKPVRAFLHVKVKSVFWKEYEEYLMKRELALTVPTTRYLLSDALNSSTTATTSSITNDSSNANTVPTAESSSLLPYQYQTMHWYECLPPVILIHHDPSSSSSSSTIDHTSSAKKRLSSTCDLWNYHKHYSMKIIWQMDSAPNWLTFTSTFRQQQQDHNDQSVNNNSASSSLSSSCWQEVIILQPRQSVHLTFHHDVPLSFNRLVDMIEACNAVYSPEIMPQLGPLLSIPLNDPTMTITAVLLATVSWWSQQSPAVLIAERTLHLPVSCSLAQAR